MNTDTLTPVAILVRVSTQKQETDRQIHELTEICNQNNWQSVEVIREQVSGASTLRPGLDRAIELARTKQVRKVVVHEVSRVARKNSTAHKFIEDLADLGVSLYWHSQRIETLLPDGRRNPAAAIMFSLLAEMARNERETMRERVMSGLAEARRKGKTLGRPVGSTYTPTQLIDRYPTLTRRLKEGHSIRHAATLAEVSKDTATRVRAALIATGQLPNLTTP